MLSQSYTEHNIKSELEKQISGYDYPLDERGDTLQKIAVVTSAIHNICKIKEKLIELHKIENKLNAINQLLG